MVLNETTTCIDEPRTHCSEDDETDLNRMQGDIPSSPLSNKRLNRRPFSNISNLVSGMAFSNSSNILAKSVNAVSQTSQLFFSSISLGVNKLKLDLDSEVETDYDYEEDEASDEFSSQDDDTFETINMGSPIPGKGLHHKKSSSIAQITEDFSHREDNSHLKHTKIRTFTHVDDSLPRINEDELYKILSGELKNEFDEYIIIDCRFNYEFNGGHIIDAINISTKEDLEQKFIVNDQLSPTKKRLLIFHCEFSVFRGPVMARHLRKCDRTMNANQYPYLTFPDIVVLEGGYKRFFDKYRQYCNPQGYVEMKDLRHEKLCENQLNKVRKENKLTRAKSFQDCYPDYSLDRNFTFGHTKSQSFTHDKISKRPRSSKQKFSPFDPNRRASPAASPLFNEHEFPQPPSTSFRKYTHQHSQHHHKSYSMTIPASSTSSFNSTTSSTMSITSPLLYSDVGSVSSCESLADPYSSLSETTNSELYFECRKRVTIPPPPPPPQAQSPAIATPNIMLRKKSVRGGNGVTNPSSSSFKFPNKARARGHTVSSIPLSFLDMSSPTISSPLSNQKVSAGDISIDAINESPVEFSLKTNRGHQRISSLLSNEVIGGNDIGRMENRSLEEEEHQYANADG